MSAQMAQVNARVARLSIGEQPSSAAKTYATSFKEYEARSKPIKQPEFDFTTNKSGWKRFQEMLQEFQVCMETLFVLVTYFSFSTTGREKESRKNPFRGQISGASSSHFEQDIHEIELC